MCESSKENLPIEIPHLSYHTFLKVLEFLYTDSVSDVSPDLGIQIMVASELFLLDRLKALCEDIIRKEINLDNATTILLESHQHNAAGLKDIALEYILRNLKNKDIQIGLNDLKSQPDLLVDIIKLASLQICVSNTSEEDNRRSPGQFHNIGLQQGPQEFM